LEARPERSVTLPIPGRPGLALPKKGTPRFWGRDPKKTKKKINPKGRNTAKSVKKAPKKTDHQFRSLWGGKEGKKGEGGGRGILRGKGSGPRRSLSKSLACPKGTGLIKGKRVASRKNGGVRGFGGPEPKTKKKKKICTRQKKAQDGKKNPPLKKEKRTKWKKKKTRRRRKWQPMTGWTDKQARLCFLGFYQLKRRRPKGGWVETPGEGKESERKGFARRERKKGRTYRDPFGRGKVI